MIMCDPGRWCPVPALYRGGGGGDRVGAISQKNRSKYCFLNKRPIGLIAPPFIIDFLATENLPKVSSNIAPNHSSGL